MTGFGDLGDHLALLRLALADLERQEAVLRSWSRQLVAVFRQGGRLLAAGNGGSAAEAQHLTAELVGRFGTDRPPLSAIALHADTSSLTAIVNDFSAEEMFARQITAHGRPGDVLILLTTSGRSPNLVRAAEAGRAGGLQVWGLTGPVPNPVADRADSTVADSTVAIGTLSIGTVSTAAVQEAHLVAVHALCSYLECGLEPPPTPPTTFVAAGPGTVDGAGAGAGATRARVRRGAPAPSAWA